MSAINELNDSLLMLSRELGLACNKLEADGREYAIKNNLYRKAKAQAYLLSEGKTIDAKKADVDLQCENERLAAHLAEAARIATYERVKSIRAQLSALQTITTSTRVELETLNVPDPRDEYETVRPRSKQDEEDSIPF